MNIKKDKLCWSQVTSIWCDKNGTLPVWSSSLKPMNECVRVLQWLSCLQLFETLDCSLPDSSVHGFSYQEYCSGLPLPTPGDLPDPGIEPTYLASPALPADSLLLSHRGSPNHKKNIRQIQIEGPSRKHLTILLKTVKVIKNQENLTNC